MSDGRQEETEFGGSAASKQRKFIHFSSGETLEVEDSEEEEEEEEEEELSSEKPPKRARFSFKNVALLVGRFSLLTCDFLGERLAGALGLNAAKYQYAIDQYQRDHKATDSRVAGKSTETLHLSPAPDRSRYGATAVDSCDDTHTGRTGLHNRGYQADDGVD